MPRGVVVPVAVLACARRQAGLVASWQCDEARLGSHARGRLVRSGRWISPTRGVFDTTPMADAVRHPDERRRRSAWLGLLAYGPEAIGVGPSALALQGVAGLPAQLDAQVALPAGRSAPGRDGIRVRHFDRFATMTLGGRRVATIDAALVQALPELPRLHAVAVLDHVLNRRLIDSADLAAVRLAIRGRRGAASATWWDLVDGRAESPLETEARLRFVDEGIRPDDLQVVIRDSRDRFVGRGDMGWRLRNGRWLLAELDGREFHDAPQALYADRSRQNRMLATGRVDLLRFTHQDFRSRPGPEAAVRAALTADAARRTA